MALKNRIGQFVVEHQFDYENVTTKRIAKALKVKFSTIRGRVSEMVKRGELRRGRFNKRDCLPTDTTPTVEKN